MCLPFRDLLFRALEWLCVPHVRPAAVHALLAGTDAQEQGAMPWVCAMCWTCAAPRFQGNTRKCSAPFHVRPKGHTVPACGRILSHNAGP